MSLMKTLAKVAIGVAVAKGASSLMNKQSSAGGTGLGGLLGGLAGAAGGSSGAGSPFGGTHSPSTAGAAGGGSLQDMLGGLLGGGAGGSAGGLGGMLEQLGGGGAGGGGGLQDMLGGLAGAAGGGGLLGGLAGAMQKRPASNSASFGEVLNSSFDQTPQATIEPSADQEAAAALMLRAMIQAAKSDGQLDDAEQEKLVGQLGGDVDQEEAAFVRSEMQKPVDVQSVINDTPAGMGAQVYAMSLLAINLDSQNEAKYLHSLAQGYGLDPAQVNDIHSQLGVPSLYT
ncbi:MAG: DUF533 domain-containing protein [Paracoccaceae bacterium]